jgi:transaldolase
MSGRLRRLVAQGIRGVTSNPTIIAKAIGSSADYDGQLAALTAAGRDAEASYWALVTSDLNGALAVLRPIYDLHAAPWSSRDSPTPPPAPSWPPPHHLPA